jgi:hypothetical protein
MKSFISVLKRLGSKKSIGAKNETVREMSQLLETIFKGEEKQELLTGIYRLVEKGCVGRA